MGPRSWHPSPFASDEEVSSDEPQFYKEEKKNRIKMEIARRRQQIEENACLHEEITRLAKLRESAEFGGTGAHHPPPPPPQPAFNYVSTGMRLSGAHDGHTNTTTTSVLKSVDEILRDGDAYRRPNPTAAFNPDVYTASVYDRVTDFSPINSELGADYHGRIDPYGGKYSKATSSTVLK